MRLFPLLAATLLAVASLPVHADFEYSFPKTGVSPPGNSGPPPGEGEGSGGGEPPGEGGGPPAPAPVLAAWIWDPNPLTATLFNGGCVDILRTIEASIDGDQIHDSSDPRWADLTIQVDYTRASPGGPGVFLAHADDIWVSIEEWGALTDLGDSGTYSRAVSGWFDGSYMQYSSIGICQPEGNLGGTWDFTVYVTVNGGNTVTLMYPGWSFYSSGY